MAFMGTTVTYGRGTAVVVETGMRTELGHIADMLQTIGEERTPLQQRMAELGKWLAIGALIICGIVFAAGVWRGGEVTEMFLTAVSLAVAAVPEGLPAVVTIALALGAQRMVRRNALIRKLPAVETLGLFSNTPLLGAVLLTIALQMAVVYVPFLQAIFRTVPLTAAQLGISLAMSAVVFFAAEGAKLIRARVSRRHPAMG
jgi:magnesium-transporting ATPase (P-type)